VVAAHTPAELRQRMAGDRRLLVEVRSEDAARAEAAFAAVPGVAAVTRDGEGRLALTLQAATGDIREEVFRAAVAAGLVLRELRAEAFSLEEIFAHITTSEPARG
jgi:hypothetical protein